jgi:phospho-N-acetylmuramoyl-pentapeptide-transferase
VLVIVRIPVETLVLIGERFVTSLPVVVISAGALSLVLSLAFGPWLIGWLKLRFTERIASDSAKLNELHAAKQNTPTMGGLLISATTIFSVLCFSDPSSPVVWLFCGTVLAFTLLGAYDDWIKLRTQRKGLTARQKLSAQVIMSLGVAVGIYLLHHEPGSVGTVSIPWSKMTFRPSVYWIPWAVFVIIGASNAVNLTDGLDGLASGSAAISSIALAVVICSSKLAGLDENNRMIAAVSCAALAGSTLGFLWWNRHPARIFMGDAGSLPIGGLLAIASLATGTELLLAIIGVVFVVETFSVILQVAWYRRTRRRILLCSPLHNHFVFRGVAETKIVQWFWLAAIVAALLGVSAAFW